MKKIMAVIVTYNPDINELKDSLIKLLPQVSNVLICNNSNYEIDCSFIGLDKVIIINLGENLGIAAAQNIGMKWAFENGADFVLQLDQDSEIQDNFAMRLMKTYYLLASREYNVGLVGPQDFDKITGEINHARLKKGTRLPFENLFSVDSTLSSGSLIPKSTYEMIGGMMDELFIDVVDHEYCWRMKAHGFLVIKDNSIMMGHRLGDGRTKILGFISVGVPSPFRHYYAFRNSIYLLRMNYVPLYWKLTLIPKLTFKLFFYPLFLTHGFVRLRFMIKGIAHGLIGKLGHLE